MSPEIKSNRVPDRLREIFLETTEDPVEDAQEFRGELTISVGASFLRGVCEHLRDDPSLRFDYLSDLTALDHYPGEPRFQLVCHLMSTQSFERLRLKSWLSGEDPRVDSLMPVWAAAEAYENEIWDLFGIHFEGHPGLRRLVLPEDWEGHPLRKDYPTEGYRFGG